MKITIEMQDAKNGEEQKVVEELKQFLERIADSSEGVSVQNEAGSSIKVTTDTAKITQETKESIKKELQRIGRQPSEEAIRVRKAVANMAKGQWRSHGFTANELAAYLGIDRMQAMNALIFHSKGGNQLVYRAGKMTTNSKGKDPVLWKWVEATNDSGQTNNKRQRKAK